MIKVETTGSGTLGTIESWTITETITPAVPGDNSATIGDASVTVTRTPDTDLASSNELTITHPTLGEYKGRTTQVRPSSPKIATVSADSALHRLLTGRMRIPGVESGLPAAAMDMVMQAAGYARQAGPNAEDNYWSLAGHSVGFAPSGDIVHPTGVDRMLLTNLGSTSMFSKGERVLYQEITGFAAISNLTSSGLPRSVLADTPQLRERTYYKFAIEPQSTGLATTTFNIPLGPSFRRVGSNAIANPSSYLRVVVSQTASAGAISGSIGYQNEAGANVVATGTSSGSLPSFIRTQRAVVSIEVSMTAAGALQIRYSMETPLGSFSSSATSAVLGTVGRIMYPKQATITQTGSAPAGIRDLVQRHTPTDSWSGFIGLNYVAASPVINQLATTHAGSPIAGFDGELWEYVKQISAARGIEIAPTSAGIVMREQGTRTIDLTHRVSGTRVISNAVTARNVVITNQNTRTLSGPTSEAFRAETIYSVGVGETKIFTVRLPDGIRFLWSPRPWYNQTVVNGLNIPSAMWADGYSELTAGTAGRYYVSAADGFPVNPFLWTEYGGLLTVAVKDGTATITLRGPSQEIPGLSGPFRIGETDTSVEHAVLRLHGVGVISEPVTVTLPSGAPHAETRIETGATITNVAIGNIGEVYDAAAWAATRTAGPTVTLNAALPVKHLMGFGLTCGSLITFEGSTFRVDTCAITGGVATLTASRLTRLSQAPFGTLTLDEYAARHAGLTLHDFAVRPLNPPTP